MDNKPVVRRSKPYIISANPYLSINMAFEQVFCINLVRRPDRKNQAQIEFEKHGIDVEWIAGVDARDMNFPTNLISSDGLPVLPGDLGCTASHAKIVKLAKERGLKNYCVFEDDCQMIRNFNELFPLYMAQVPTDWDFVFIGGSINGQQWDISENIVKANNVFTTHAMAVKETVYDALIEVWSKQNEKVDIAVASLQTKFNTYAFKPFLVGQRASWSDIQEKETYYEHLDVKK